MKGGLIELFRRCLILFGICFSMPVLPPYLRSILMVPILGIELMEESRPT